MNQITSLDVSKNTNLSTFYCGTNKLSTLDVSKNSELVAIACYDNLLSTIDISKNSLLSLLSVRTNQLTSIDISNNSELTFLSCRDNKLKELDVSKNTKLSQLYCYGNGLTFANLSRPNPQYTIYTYAPQFALSIPKSLEKDKIFDLSTQLNAYDVINNQQTTSYTWKTNTNNNLQEGTDYSVSESGKFTFITIPSDSVYCQMGNNAFPDFKDNNTYKTTSTKIILSTEIEQPVISAETLIYNSGQIVYVRFQDIPKNVRITIYDMTGRLIVSKVAEYMLTTIPLNKSGVYVVRVDNGNSNQMAKVIINE